MVEEARRNVCSKCKRPPRVCYCSSLPDEPLAAEYTHVLVLQHEHEKKRRAAISSVPVLAQTLQDVTLVTVKDSCDCGPGVDERLDALLYEGGGDHRFDTALVLFPDEHAQPLKKNEETGRKEKVLLIVIDGTWKQAKKIARRNREHWEKAANEWEERGAKLQYICLENDGKRSIYGDLRREPMEGCMSTLEAVASALVMLEVRTGRGLQDALLRAFAGMVSIQEQFQQRGQAAKLEQYGGVSKAQAVEAKRLELQRQVKKNEATDTDKSKSVQREYVFYTSHTDFRHRQQLTQEGDVVTSTYDEAREQCVELNRDRKRGQRVAMLPLDVFEQHLRQLHDA